MYIESLFIASFGSLKSFELDLSDGINIIEGENESGKSTVCDFIRFAFYGFSGKPDRENHLSFSTGNAEGSLIVNDGGKRYRIERSLVGTKETVGIFDLDDGKKCFAGKEPGEVFFGLPEKLFTSTVFVGQTSGKKIDGKQTSESVENLLFSADETVSVKKSLQLIDKARTALIHKNKKGGRIFELEEKISELNEGLSSASQASGEIIALEGKTEELKKKISKEEAQSGELNTALDGFNILEIRKRNKKLKELERKYREIVTESDVFYRENTKNGFFPDKKYLESMRQCGEEIARADKRVKEAESSLEELNNEIRAYQATKNDAEEKRLHEIAKLSSKRSLAISAGIICCLLFIALVSVSVIMFLGAQKGAGTAVAVFAAVFFGGMVTGLVFSSRFASEMRELKEDVNDDGEAYRIKLEYIRDDLEAAREEKRKYKSMLDELCGKWEITPTAKSVTELKSVLDREEELKHETELRRVAYISLKTEAEEKSRYEPEDSGEEIILPDGFDPKEYKRRSDFLAARLKIDIEMLHKDEIRLAQLKASEVSPSELLSQINILEFEKQKLSEKCDGYMLAYEKLEEASQKMRESVSPRLSQMAGGYMDGVTDGKYNELGVDGGFGLTFRPETGSGGRVTKGDEFMSAGTSDAAYISLRLALASLICGEDKTPPMVFDESFSYLDDNRLGNMLALLSGFNGQVILLSSHDREKRIAEKNGIAFSSVRL